MSHLEDLIRSTLDTRAPITGVRTIPQGTLRRIRVRQAVSSVIASVIVAALAVGAFEAFSIPFDRSRPADGPGDAEIVPAPPQGAPTWDRVEAPPPGSWPDVTHGALQDGYVDRTVGEGASVLVDKTVVAAGWVQGVPWSLVALEQDGEGATWHPAAPGPCGELFLGAWGDDGGAGFCLRMDDTVGSPAMSAVGIVWGVGPLSAYAGVVTDAVDRVEVVLGSGDTRAVPLVEGPRGMTGRLFALFVPNGARGTIVARSADGDVVARQPLCAADLIVPEDATGGCGEGLMGPASPVVTDM
jgi:hypothetical protein